MAKGDGKNPKFRLLCKRCNSYMHTQLRVDVVPKGDDGLHRLRITIACPSCNNSAHSLDEEFAS